MGRDPGRRIGRWRNLPWRHEWVLVVDADEEVSLTLRDEIAAVVSCPSAYTAFLVPYQYYFLGHLLRHGAPLWKLILFKRRLARFERMEVPEVTGYDVEL